MYLFKTQRRIRQEKEERDGTKKPRRRKRNSSGARGSKNGSNKGRKNAKREAGEGEHSFSATGAAPPMPALPGLPVSINLPMQIFAPSALPNSAVQITSPNTGAGDHFHPTGFGGIGGGGMPPSNALQAQLQGVPRQQSLQVPPNHALTGQVGGTSVPVPYLPPANPAVSGSQLSQIQAALGANPALLSAMLRGATSSYPGGAAAAPTNANLMLGSSIRPEPANTESALQLGLALGMGSAAPPAQEPALVSVPPPANGSLSAPLATLMQQQQQMHNLNQPGDASDLANNNGP